MNNLDNIFKLLDAGYTKEEINQLLNPANEDDAGNSVDNKSTDDKASDDVAVNNQVVGYDKLAEAIDGLNAKIKELDTSIKKGNILGNLINAPKEPTAEDVLASILTPEPKKK